MAPCRIYFLDYRRGHYHRPCLCDRPVYRHSLESDEIDPFMEHLSSSPPLSGISALHRINGYHPFHPGNRPPFPWQRNTTRLDARRTDLCRYRGDRPLSLPFQEIQSCRTRKRFGPPSSIREDETDLLGGDRTARVRLSYDPLRYRL